MKRLPRIALVFGVLLLALLPAQAKAEPTERIIIALDVSASMRGAPLAASVAATNHLLQELDPKTQLDIYIFSQTVTLLDSAQSGESLDTSKLSTLTSGGFTSLYDAINQLSTAVRESNASLIVMTDGNDSRSRLSKDELSEQLRNFDTPIHFIAYQPKPEDLIVLEELAAITGGRIYNPESIEQLAASFRSAVNVATKPAASSLNNMPIMIASATTALALLTFNTLKIWRRREGRLDSWSELLDRYKFTPLASERSQGVKQAKNQFIARFIGDTSLVAPQIKSRALRESLTIGLFILIFGLLITLGIPLFASFALATLFSLLLLKLLVAQATNRVRIEFEAELPGSLKLLASSLAAGLSFLQALDSFSQESKNCVGKELRRALHEVQMGAAIERALGDIADRMASEDLRWVVYAFSVQREVGGSLAKILQTSAETIEARSNLRQEIRTLSAEGRISSYILMALPPTIFLFLLLTRPSFISLFWEESIGHAMLATISVLILLAWLWIRGLIRQEA